MVSGNGYTLTMSPTMFKYLWK